MIIDQSGKIVLVVLGVGALYAVLRARHSRFGQSFIGLLVICVSLPFLYPFLVGSYEVLAQPVRLTIGCGALALGTLLVLGGGNALKGIGALVGAVMCALIGAVLGYGSMYVVGFAGLLVMHALLWLGAIAGACVGWWLVGRASHVIEEGLQDDSGAA